jgi:tetratricopeptide (TPR) repeat protein
MTDARPPTPAESAAILVLRQLAEHIRGSADLSTPGQGPAPAENDAAPCPGYLETIARLLEEGARELEALVDHPGEAVAAAVLQGRDHEAVKRFFHLGLTCYLHGEYQQAAAHFTAALQLDPTDARLHAHRGDAYRLVCNYERAIADFEAALRLDPCNASVLLSRASAYQDSGAHERAAADCTAVLAATPNNAAAYRIRAAACAALGSHDAALADLTTAIALAPEDAEAYYQRGVVRVGLRQYTQAVADLNRVVELNPHHVPAYLHRGFAHRCLNDYAGAIRDYSEVLRHHPSNVLALAGRGSAYRLTGDLARALADYEEALRLEPGNARVHSSRGVLYRIQGDLERARADLDEAVRREPENWAALYHRSKVFLVTGRFAEALADLTKALSLNPRIGVAYLSRAVIHDRLGQNEEGIADGTQAVILDPRSAAARLVRGVVYSHRADHAAAVADLTEAIRLDPRLALAYQERSMAYILQGEHDRALADCSQLLTLEPGNAQAYANRSIVHHFKGDVQKALTDYSRAMQLDPRCLLAGWNQALAESARLQTAQRLADTIDGLRLESSVGEAPPPARFQIVLRPPRVEGGEEEAATPAGVSSPPAEPEGDRSVSASKETRPRRPATTDAPRRKPERPANVAPAVEQAAALLDDLAAERQPASARSGPAPDRIANGTTVASAPAARTEAAVPATERSPLARPVWKPRPRPARKAGADEETDSRGTWRKRGVLAATGLAALVLIGLGSRYIHWDHVRVYPAHGQAAYEGKPIPNARIILDPAWTEDPPFPRPHALVKDDGSFVLGTYGKEDGAPPGEYRVSVQWLVQTQKIETEGNPLPRNLLPARYGNFATSGLSVQIQQGENLLPVLQLKR